MTSAYFVVSVTSLLGIAIVTAALLKGWRDWLALKARELDRPPREIACGSPSGAARIELADLKERVRQLEAIAAGVDR
jgi:hypothetical protein